ncbi:hypothetical protein [Sphingobacterium luzhongxinii]|uniref:hypothetical protein n=1 Tax=Sphingobacterium luzhongxinii TaxID=2654181 RepID=UPI0013DB74C3|nr:hypothetical protein [Sphingobacterium sp. xlx-73]
MKKLFLLLRQELMTIPSINWVDLNKGQLNNYEERPAIDFPAVLLELSYPRTTKLTGTQQQCDVEIRASIIFDFMDETSSITPDETLEKSLEVYDIVQEVHEKLQGLIDIKTIRSPLERMSQRDTPRADKLKVFQVTYNTRLLA